jgi:hypothetical protein
MSKAAEVKVTPSIKTDECIMATACACTQANDTQYQQMDGDGHSI